MQGRHKGCTDGNVCVLAVTPHVCMAPQLSDEAGKCDAVCESKKCEIPSGKDVGKCS